MEVLYELAKLNIRNRKILDSLIPISDNSPLLKLTSIIFSEEMYTDNDCMLEIYGRRKIVAFSRLKARLKEILYQGILLKNYQNEQDGPDTFDSFAGFKESVIAKTLAANRSNKLAIDLLEKSIIKSIKYDLTENIIIQSRILILYYGSTSFNKYKHSKYLSLQQNSLINYHWEIKAENYFLELQRTTIQSLGNPSEETKKKALNYSKELEEITNIKTYDFIYNKFRVMATHYEYEKNYTSLLSLSERTLAEINTYGHKSGIERTNVSLRRMWALIQAGRLEETIKIGYELQKNLISGSVTWYRVYHYFLKAQLYKGDYKKAVETITVMVNHQNFNKIGENYKEIFYTTLGYLHLIVESGFAGEISAIQYKLPEFKLGRFLNTVPVFSKDKRGINVSILLMHIAFLLQRKDFNAIIDRTDSLNQYAYRYLRKDETFRSNCMIKMVIQMTKADFHPLRTERYTQELRAELVQVSLVGSGENIEIEIIPFEILWDIMRASL